MIREVRYKIEVDPGSPRVNVLECVPYYNIWEFVRAYPEYRKYTDPYCRGPVMVYLRCRAADTALWKMVDALTYWGCSRPTNIKRTLKELKDLYGVNVSSGMRDYLTTTDDIRKAAHKMYRLNLHGEWVRGKLVAERFPTEALAAADRKQEAKYLKAVEMSKKVIVDYHNWETEKVLGSLE